MRRSKRNKKNNQAKENNLDKNSRKRKEKKDIYSRVNFEMQDFHSDPINNIIRRKKHDIIDNTVYINNKNILYSPKKAEKLHNEIINNFMEIDNEMPELPYSVRNGRNQRKRAINNNYLNNKYILNDKLVSYNANRKKSNKDLFAEINCIELKENLKVEIPKKGNKNTLSQKAKGRKRTKSNNVILNDNELFYNTNNAKKVESKKSRMTRSYTTRNRKKEMENVNKLEKSRESKRAKTNKNKGKKVNIIQEEKKENFDNLNNIKYKSRSHMLNSIEEIKRKEIENIKKKVEKRSNRDHLSPRNYYQNNISCFLNNGIKEGRDILKNHSTQKMFNNNENKIEENISKKNEKKNKKKNKDKLLNDYIYSLTYFDKKKFTITLNKRLKTPQYNNIIKKDLFKVNQDENVLGRKRRRNEPRKEKEKKKENKNKSNKPKNKPKREKKKKTKNKNNHKEKFQNSNEVKIKQEDNESPYQLNKLKSELNNDQNKAVEFKGKKRTRKHKSVKKNENPFVKIEEEINSFESYSEPDKDFNSRDYYYPRNNYNFNFYNQINFSNDQMQLENAPSNDLSKSNLQSNIKSNNNTNININNKINSNNANNIKNYPNYDIANTNYLKINLSSNNSFKDLNSETANFMEMSNNFEYSFPIDLEEKIDIKEDKTYYTKASKYLKYHPIDKYIPPISNTN